jgi:hypothetical protein
MILDVEVLPSEEHSGRGCLGNGLPGLLFGGRRALPVHVDEDRQIVVPGVEIALILDHRQHELVQHEKLLR